jgi:hypothetical protein
MLPIAVLACGIARNAILLKSMRGPIRAIAALYLTIQIS